MNGLMPALVAALLAQATDRSGWAAAALVDRWRRSGAVIGAAILVVAATNAVAAIGGALIASRLTPNAAALLLAVALLFAGVGALLPAKRPNRYVDGRGGAFFASLTSFFGLAFGDRAAFVTLALAAGSALPALPAIGATLGGVAVIAAFAAVGEAGRRRLPMLAIRIVTGALFVIAGAVAGLSALRLI